MTEQQENAPKSKGPFNPLSPHTYFLACLTWVSLPHRLLLQAIDLSAALQELEDDNCQHPLLAAAFLGPEGAVKDQGCEQPPPAVPHLELGAVPCPRLLISAEN